VPIEKLGRGTAPAKAAIATLLPATTTSDCARKRAIPALLPPMPARAAQELTVLWTTLDEGMTGGGLRRHFANAVINQAQRGPGHDEW